MLSYLAGGFDWQSDYVMTLRRDDRTDLFAWVTLASSDFTSLPDAATAVVAGKPNKQVDDRSFDARGDGGLALRCWPADPDYRHPRPISADGEQFRAPRDRL